MPWNNQGGSDDGGPWGSGNNTWGNKEGKGSNKPRRSSSGMSDLDELINRLQARLKRLMAKKGWKPPLRLPNLLWALLVVVLIGWLSTGFYQVKEGDVGVVLRFGQMVRISMEGLRYHWPKPIERVINQRVAAVNRIDGGVKVDNKSTAETPDQALILTGDENMVITSYTILWRIKDVTAFLFITRDPEVTIHVAAESVLREVFGLNTAKTALTEGREAIGQKTQELLQKLMDEYHMGVEIISVQLQRVEPPIEVIASFHDVQSSLVDADRYSNEAQAYSNDIIPRARGEAQAIINEAQAYAQQIVAEAEGEGSRFISVLEAASLNRNLFMIRAYLATMEKVLSKADKIILDPAAIKNGNVVLPLLGAGPAMKKLLGGEGGQ